MKRHRTATAKDQYRVHKEAIVLERMSHSPRILDIYGHCGTSILLEPMASELVTKLVPGTGLASQANLNKLSDVRPRNQLTASEKLHIALSMVESLADLHGFSDGPIIHADANPEQWLITSDGTIKLNDFNNAVEMRWNITGQKFCERKGAFRDAGRSPEECHGTSQNESVDVYAIGNFIYSLVCLQYLVVFAYQIKTSTF